MEDKWPRYVPVTFATGVNVSPEDLATLNRAKLPEIALGAGKILAVPIGIFIPDRGYLIQLAHGGYEGIYYDPSTGRVVAIHDWPGPDPRLVNSTLRQYTSTVKAITSAFPFYSKIESDLGEVETEARLNEREVIADRLGELIREIDTAAMTPNNHWASFVTDVANGDYSTENVLREEDADPG